MSQSPRFPRVVRRERSVEIRPAKGLWARYEGRVVLRVWYEGNAGPHEHHLFPGHSGYNGTPYWSRSRSYFRLRARLLRFCDRQDAERARKAAVGRVPA